MPSSSDSAIYLSIIIANYNGRDFVADCLESLYRNPPSCSFEVLVVDDASTDGSADVVRARFPEVQLLRNEQNIHYARANNRALDVARGALVHLLNNDTIVLPGAFDAMVHFLTSRPSVGAVGSKLFNEDGSVQASVKTLPSPMSALFGARSIVTKFLPANPFARRHLLHLRNGTTHPFPAGYVSSASIMIRRSVIDQVGYLDNRLSYHVDADYCKRIWDAGWEVYYLPTAAMVHLNHKGGTMVNARRRLKSVVEFHYGSFIYYRKHRVTHPWHPMQAVTALGLGVRFALSLGMLATSELFQMARTHLITRRRGDESASDRYKFAARSPKEGTR